MSDYPLEASAAVHISVLAERIPAAKPKRRLLLIQAVPIFNHIQE
jgi:hypothetical protein